MKKYAVILSLLLCCAYGPVFGQDGRSTSIVTIAGESYYVHTVRKGETVSSLSRLYSVPAEELIKVNPHIADVLQADQVIKIPAVRDNEVEKLSTRKKNKLFDVHVVNQGETLYSISRRYEIPVNTLLEDNEGLDPAKLQIGQRINIRKKSKGDASPEEIDRQMSDYVEAINSVTSDTVYHLVERGETIYGLSRQYDVTEESITSANDLAGGLKAGQMIRIPKVTGGDGSTGEKAEPADSVDTVLWPWRRPGSGSGATVKDLSGRSSIEVAILLPFKNDKGEGDRNYLDFYRGALIALEDIKAQGVSAKVSVYNTSRSRNVVSQIVESPDFEGTDLIIGPVFEESLAPVLDYAEKNGVPVAFPLAEAAHESSPMLYQFRPDAASKYDKLKELLAGDKNIIYINTKNPDQDLDKNVKPLLTGAYKDFQYSGNIKSTSFENLIDKKGDNIILISCANERVADEILAGISSMHSNLVARSMFQGDLRVVASSFWATRFVNTIDKNLYFKLKLCFVTGYHAESSNELVKKFDKRYIGAYGAPPSNYSYRGYDVAKLFVASAFKRGADFTAKLNAKGETLLQMSYRFAVKTPGGNFINDQWAMVCYRPDYTIEVK